MTNYLSSKEAAERMGITEGALRSGRSKGVLLGVKPPAFTKRGQLIFYKEETVEAWLASFEEVEG